MKCKYCLEEIKDGAIKCKHCKSVLGSNSFTQTNSHSKKTHYDSGFTKTYRKNVFESGTTEVYDLWNPKTVAWWSLLLSPFFAMWIYSENWKSLKLDEESLKTKIWLMGTLIVVIFYFIFFVDEYRGNIDTAYWFGYMFGTWVFILIPWFLLDGIKQVECFKNINCVFKKSWTIPVIVVLSIYTALILMLGNPDNYEDIVFSILFFLSYSSYPLIVVVFFVRIYKYTLGRNGYFIHIPNLLAIAGLFSIFVPILNWLVIGYTFFWCKSIPRLLEARELSLKLVTPMAIVDATEDLILNNGLTDDDWVRNTWNMHPKSYWVKRLSSNPDLLRQTLQTKLKIHVSTLDPIANWADIVKHFVYLEEREIFNQ